MNNLADLKLPFDPKQVSWRVGSTNADKTQGLALCYIDSRDVQERLDAVCGPENWDCHYMNIGATIICEIGIKINDEWVRKADGAGASDIEAEKGGLSDSFKRAAVKWGVGRYLYDISPPWVALEQAGRSQKIKPSEMSKLWAALGGKTGGATILGWTPDTAPSLISKPAAPDAAHGPPSVPPAKRGAPAPSVDVSDEVKKRAARDWARKHIELVTRMNRADLDKWSDDNHTKIASIRNYDTDLHAKLVDGIKDRYALLDPANAG